MTKQRLSNSFAYASLACSLAFWLLFGLYCLLGGLHSSAPGWQWDVSLRWKWVLIEAFSFLLAILSSVIGLTAVGARLWRIACPVALLMFVLTLRSYLLSPQFSGARTEPSYPDRTVPLSNSALLRIHSSLPVGAGDFTWEASYRDKTGWEKVDDWMVEGQMSWYGGDILACPVGKLVVIVRTDGSLVFVRTEAGHWKTFHMEIPERAPFPLIGPNGTNFTSLETPAIKDLRSRMSMESAQGNIRSSLGQFLPDRRELWVDYLNLEDRRFRVQFRLTADGEKLEFLDMESRSFNRATDTSGAPFFLIHPDKSVPAPCNKIEFSR